MQIHSNPSDSLKSQVGWQRRRSESRRNRLESIKNWAHGYKNRREAYLPKPGKQVRVDVIARGLLDPVPLRTAAFIGLVLQLNLANEIAKRFLHYVLSFTLKMRPYRFPEKSAETALKKIDECSAGMLSDEEVQSWIRRCGNLPNRLNGDNLIGFRKSGDGHNRSSYKNAVFQAALANTAQYAYRKEAAIETTILAAVVNIRTEDVIGRMSSHLQQLRLT